MENHEVECWLNFGAAIIRQAIHDLGIPQYRKQTAKWFSSQQFSDLCDVLKINAGYIKEQIKEKLKAADREAFLSVGI